VPELARIEKATPLTPSEVFLELKIAGGRALGHRPGQFVQVSTFGFGEAPFSVCSSPTRPENFQLCVRAVGRVSRALDQVEAGDWVGIRGPYGRPFPIEEMKGRDVLAVAGGLGIVPLRSLVTYVVDNRNACGRFVLLYGAKKPSSILFENEMATWRRAGIEIILTVDEPDGTWGGRTGVVVKPLRDVDIDPCNGLAVLVGPPVLFRFATAECMNKGLTEDRIFVSLERNFRCGVGKCGHCQINDLYVCRDGPVFRLTQLLGRTEAVEAWAPEDNQD